MAPRGAVSSGTRRLADEAVALAFASGAERAVFLFDPANAAVAAMARSLRVDLTGRGTGVVRPGPERAIGVVHVRII